MPALTPTTSPARKALSRPFATPTLSGVRQLWDASSVASGLTPETLAGILRACDQGDGRAYLRLAMEMESRDAHYRSVLGTRKRAVTRLPIAVEAASDDATDQRLADEIRALAKAPGFRSMLAHALDGLGKGFAAIELRWDTSRSPWVPRDRVDAKTGERIGGYSWIDPRWFRYDQGDGRTLRLLDPADPLNGLALPAHRYLIHEPELMSGLPLWRGLARVVCVAYMAKSYTLKDWLAFAEVFGMPLRVGKYGPSASEEDIATLISAVANLGTDAAAAIPESMAIEFIEAAKTSSAEVFSQLADWADKQISKAVLGQTASADGTPGALGNQDGQEQVRDDLRDADAEELADTLNRDLVASYLVLNHGGIEPEDAPQIVLRAQEPEDIKALADALAVFIPLGLRVEASVIRDKLGLPDPDDNPDAELLGPPSGTAAQLPSNPRQLPGQVPVQDGAQTNRVALNRADPGTEAQLAANLGARAQPLVDALLATIRQELDAAPDLTTFYDRLTALYPDLDGADLTDLLGQAFAVSELAGRLET